MIATRLKQETSALHASLDRSPALARLLSPALTLDEYAVVLKVFRSLYVAFEDRCVAILSAHASLKPEYAQRRKAALLDADLAVLGVSDQWRPVEPLPLPETLGEVFGCLYVLEGATLGGQYIARKVADHLGLRSNSGLAFFLSYGDDVRRMWDDTVTILNARGVEEHEDMVRSAKAVFAAFTKNLHSTTSKRPEPALEILSKT